MSTALDPTIVSLPDVLPYDETDAGPNHRAHLVRPWDNGVTDPSDPTTGQDIVDLARLSGTEVVAACGYRWVPKRNPKNYPVCDPCLDIATAAIGG